MADGARRRPRARSREGTAFQYMTLSPPGTPEPAVAIAGSRARAIGVLNLEFASHPDAALTALSGLGALGRGTSAVLVDGGDLLATILDTEVSRLDIVAATASALAGDGDVVASIHARGKDVYLYATTLEEASARTAAGVDAVIARGQPTWTPRMESPGWTSARGVMLRRAAVSKRVAGAAELTKLAREEDGPRGDCGATWRRFAAAVKRCVFHHVSGLRVGAEAPYGD